MGKDLQKCFTKNGNNTNDHIIMLQQWKKVRNGHFCCTLLHEEQNSIITLAIIHCQLIFIVMHRMNARVQGMNQASNFACKEKMHA